MRKFNWVLVFVCALVGAAAPVHAMATQISYVVQGVGSGAVNGSSFTNQPFTFTVVADTDNVVSGGFYMGVNNDSISLQLGATNYTGFAGSSYVFPRPAFPNTSSFAFVQALVGDDWDSAQFEGLNLAFATYELKTDVGPLSIGAPSDIHLFLQATTANIAIQTMSQVTFQATLVPEPSTVALVLCGIVCLALRRGWRR